MNLIFYATAQAAFCFLLRTSPASRIFIALAAMVSPFLWSYLDEARPYVMQFCGATLMTVAIWNVTFFPRSSLLPSDICAFCIGAVILCGSSLLGAIPAFFFGLLMLLSLDRNKQLIDLLKSKSAWVVIATASLIMAGLGAYYAWTLSLGAKASSVGQTSLATILFGIYELSGFSGFGPGRLELREVGPRALGGYLGFLVIGSLPYLLVLAWLVLRPAMSPKGVKLSAIAITVCLLATFLAVVAVGFLGNFRVIGRHFTPLVPFLFILLGLLWARMWASMAWRWAVGFSLLIFVGGSLTQRLDARFAKDDYLSASSVARAALADGQVVWWAADPAASNYYGVFPSVGTSSPTDLRNSPPATSPVFFANNRDGGYLAGLPKADVVVLSKTDIYDATGALRDWMKGNRFTVTKTFPAFTIWEREK
ncbi:MAG: hypothetical protein ACOYM3_24450 [Terrimicrobiaceae bacterium]